MTKCMCVFDLWILSQRNHSKWKTGEREGEAEQEAGGQSPGKRSSQQ